MAKHALDFLVEKADNLQKNIKKKYSDNKALGRQIIVGARETADYISDDPRWSMNWYVNFIKELENRV